MLTRLLAVFLFAASLYAQTLARPGWAGSGLNIEPWWTHAVLYNLDPHHFAGDFHGVTGKLDYIHSLGVDAIVLSHIQPDAAPETVDAALGTLDDFDDLVREASRAGIRVLIQLDPSATPDLGKTARFWLGHGIGGLCLAAAATPEQRPVQLRTLRETLKTVSGQRILIAEAAPNDLTDARGADLVLVHLAPASGLDAATLRPLLTRLSNTEGTRPIVAIDNPLSDNQEATKALAALLLATRANAEVQAGQETATASRDTPSWGDAARPKPGTVAAQETDNDSPLNWYRRLIDLHHGNGTIRSGGIDFLDHDAEGALVWVMRKPQVTPTAPALVFLCNLSAKPVTLSLTDDLRALHLRGTFLRTLARSDRSLGGMGLNAVTLPPYGVYMGELRF